MSAKFTTGCGAPPPDISLFQNQSLCGPLCVSRERAHNTLPNAPFCVAAMAFKVLGV